MMIELEFRGCANVVNFGGVDLTATGEFGSDTIVRLVWRGCKGMGGALGTLLLGVIAGEEGGDVTGGEGGGDLGGEGGRAGVNHGGKGGGQGGAGGLIFVSKSLVGDSSHLKKQFLMNVYNFYIGYL